ncbi:MAG: TSUP family transporter [Bdellovibrionales bacterium]|nr:TSUP family transporter [Bdellovibrionales bacterium]
MVWIIPIIIFATSFVSGILGMAGGMVLIGVLSLTFSIANAMILHGITQIGANGFRAFLLRRHIQFKVLLPYILGAGLGFLLFSAINFIPSKSTVLIAVGIFPFVSLLMPKSIPIDILKRKNAFICGISIITLQLLAGASGPILDVFFVKSSLNRHQIIATKAITQTLGHLIKLLYYSQILFFSIEESLEVPYLLFPVAIACAFLGTTGGKLVLDKLSEFQFQKYSKIAIALIGGLYILKGLILSF